MAVNIYVDVCFFISIWMELVYNIVGKIAISEWPKSIYNFNVTGF